jgi:hypothetical protein
MIHNLLGGVHSMNTQTGNIFINSVTVFFNHPFFIVAGGMGTILMICFLIYTIFLVLKGIVPVWYRLGIGLSKRRVAIFASNDNFENIRASLLDSLIFKEKNIVHIPSSNIDKAKDQTIFLVDWETFKDEIEQVFSARKNHQTAVVIYAKPASITSEKMNDIGNRPNTVVVNFRGRLLNDILTSLITTVYEQK